MKDHRDRLDLTDEQCKHLAMTEQYMTAVAAVINRYARPDERAEVGSRINPATAIVFFRYLPTLDPYLDAIPDERGQVPEWDQVGREYFAVDPDEGVAVWWGDLPEATQTALDGKWTAANAEGWRSLWGGLGLLSE